MSLVLLLHQSTREIFILSEAFFIFIVIHSCISLKTESVDGMGGVLPPVETYTSLKKCSSSHMRNCNKRSLSILFSPTATMLLLHLMSSRDSI